MVAPGLQRLAEGKKTMTIKSKEKIYDNIILHNYNLRSTGRGGEISRLWMGLSHKYVLSFIHIYDI